MGRPPRKEGSVKTCSKCGETKALGLFGKANKRKDGTYGVRGQCKVCIAKSWRKNMDENSEEHKAYMRLARAKWRKENPGKDARCASRWRKNHPFGAKLISSRAAARAGGFEPCDATEEDLIAAFTGKCDVCGVPEVECNTKLHMDHCHETGEFRGLLCGSCNKALGMLKDSEEIIINLLHYTMKQRVE